MTVGDSCCRLFSFSVLLSVFLLFLLRVCLLKPDRRRGIALPDGGGGASLSQVQVNASRERAGPEGASTPNNWRSKKGQRTEWGE